jgi:hypothetical protein
MLESILAAHGGLAAFQQVNEIIVDGTIGGRLIYTRGLSGHPRRFQINIKTTEVQTTLTPFPQEGFRGVFTPNQTWIESLDGVIQRSRENPRERFRWGTLSVPWDDLDLLYFFGYALWNYFMTPFVFTWPGFSIKEAAPLIEGKETWRALEVTFPKSIPTHCDTQTFYFDERGLLRRLDYMAEIFGRVARGAHYCYEHKSFDGVMIPTKREVFVRVGRRPLRLMTVMDGRIHAVTLSR